jgi:hypothetical protein
MWHKYVGQHAEYVREKMIESYDIEAREKEKAQEEPKGIPDTSQNPPDFSPGCPTGRSPGKDDQ